MSVIVIATLYAKDSQEAIKRLQLELSGAAKVYGKDGGTCEWLPVQNTVDRRAFSVFERFDSESSYTRHREHPYREKFVAALKELLDKPVQQSKFEELGHREN